MAYKRANKMQEKLDAGKYEISTARGAIALNVVSQDFVISKEACEKLGVVFNF